MIGMLASSFLILLTLSIAVLVIVLILNPFHLYRQWTLRHIPGSSPRFLLGHIPQMLELGPPALNAKLAKVYGPVFKVWFGRVPTVVVTDPEIIRSIGVKNMSRLGLFNNILPRRIQRVDEHGLFSTREKEWRLIHRAWQPAFNPTTMASYVLLIDQSALRLTDLIVRKMMRLQQHHQAVGAVGACDPQKHISGGVNDQSSGDLSRTSDSNDKRLRIDIHALLGRMTLQAVGSCAYGVELGTIEDHGEIAAGVEAKLVGGKPSPLSVDGATLAWACKEVFGPASMASFESGWSKVGAALPDVHPLVVWLANTFPNKMLKDQIRARDIIQGATRDLINAWNESKKNGLDYGISACGLPGPSGYDDSSSRTDVVGKPACGNSSEIEPACGNSETEPIPAPAPAAIADCSAAVVGSSSRSVGSGMKAVAPGSFLELLLETRDRETGQKLTDIQVQAQVQTFIFAGYETTANALAFTIYLISQHPEVQAKLVREIDVQLVALGGPGAPLTEASVSKFEYTAAVLNEGLRLYPPGFMTTRVTKEPLKLMDKYFVPAGTFINLPIMSMHLDPEIWEDPTSFKPERFLQGMTAVKPSTFIPFGLGARMCIGYKFALLEARIALIRLFSKLTFVLEPGQIHRKILNPPRPNLQMDQLLTWNMPTPV
ncbi:hypothetical protein CEUSTIGMA_g8641.t1 [Chlamydomonas eustigma]|uniref:Cytochrome P450 n=1 Tax=Chlamydomonas eustigma TaxID=1157962 RepID=A0A250XE72_9CHLO|nr:hypothetical protein CEUSTIGMA_g8641.t1 [Chlamydomonas eustigma]|eukprot:GAX81209.1 hypothetical protein CEUSTIGMA_g8641.t1 [Chlamydomonas eustigma]